MDYSSILKPRGADVRSLVLQNSSFLGIVFEVWSTDERRLALFPAWTIVRDSPHREPPSRRKQELNLYRTCVQALLNKAVQ